VYAQNKKEENFGRIEILLFFTEKTCMRKTVGRLHFGRNHIYHPFQIINQLFKHLGQCR